MAHSKGTGLRWIPQTSFALIPRYLIEQVGTIDPEKLYSFGPRIGGSPLTILGVFVPMDEKAEDFGQAKGFLWASINPLVDKIEAHMLSVDEEYRGRGIIKEAKNILEKIKAQQNLMGLVFKTTRPGGFEKAGFTKSDQIVMEG